MHNDIQKLFSEEFHDEITSQSGSKVNLKIRKVLLKNAHLSNTAEEQRFVRS